MNTPESPPADRRQEEQRSEYLASLPRKIDCLNLLLEAWQRNPENAAASAAIMAMVHQLCASSALNRCRSLQQAAEQCRDQLQETTDFAGAEVNDLLQEMGRLSPVEPKA